MEAAGEYPAEINMGLTEILLILLGILAFVVSFVIPENLTKGTSIEIEIPEEKIRELVNNEVKHAAVRIEEKTDETVTAAAEKTERYMERLSNEKIMAIQEYSDTVLNQINRNHEEAVFLYDMLNSKHIQVKNAAAEINNKIQGVKTDMEHTAQEQKTELAKEELAVKIEKEIKDLGADAIDSIAVKKNNINQVGSAETENQFELNTSVGNNKSKILKLHEEGKSNILIAKELGLGIGEVKLIIDLFENGE